MHLKPLDEPAAAGRHLAVAPQRVVPRDEHRDTRMAVWVLLLVGVALQLVVEGCLLVIHREAEVDLHHTGLAVRQILGERQRDAVAVDRELPVPVELGGTGRRVGGDADAEHREDCGKNCHQAQAKLSLPLSVTRCASRGVNH